MGVKPLHTVGGQGSHSWSGMNRGVCEGWAFRTSYSHKWAGLDEWSFLPRLQNLVMEVAPQPQTQWPPHAFLPTHHLLSRGRGV